MKRIISILLTVIVAIAGLTACAPETAPAPEGADKELEKITVVLDWVPNTNHTGMYVAQARGYYAAEGLEVEIIQPTSGGSADLIAAGQGHFGISYQEQVTYARTTKNPLPIKAIAAIIQNNTSGFAAPASKGIVSPKDFEGKKYGGWGSPMEEAMLKALMEQENADFDKLEMVDIGAADFFTAVEEHVDFTWIFYGWDGVAAKQRNMDLNFILLQDIDPALNFYTPTIIASEKLLSEDPELARRFLRATSKGYEFAIANPEEAAKDLLKAVPELDEELVVASQKYLAKEYKADAARWGEMKEEIWETYAGWMFERGLLERELDSNKAFTNEFLPDK